MLGASFAPAAKRQKVRAVAACDVFRSQRWRELPDGMSNAFKRQRLEQSLGALPEVSTKHYAALAKAETRAKDRASKMLSRRLSVQA